MPLHVQLSKEREENCTSSCHLSNVYLPQAFSSPPFVRFSILFFLPAPPTKIRLLPFFELLLQCCAAAMFQCFAQPLHMLTPLAFEHIFLLSHAASLRRERKMMWNLVSRQLRKKTDEHFVIQARAYISIVINSKEVNKISAIFFSFGRRRKKQLLIVRRLMCSFN